MPGVWEVTPFLTLTAGTIVNSARTDVQTYSAGGEKHETEGKSGFSRVLARVQNLTFKITRIPTQHYSQSESVVDNSSSSINSTPSFRYSHHHQNNLFLRI